MTIRILKMQVFDSLSFSPLSQSESWLITQFLKKHSKNLTTLKTIKQKEKKVVENFFSPIFLSDNENGIKKIL
jgi:hypothetical protein